MTVYDFQALSIDGVATPLAAYAGRVLLIVNVASRCGFTPQYAGLEALYRKHAAGGFTVLGFPCNQFGGQEPGSEADIAAFCAAAYDVTFPMFARVDVNGPRTHPLYLFLKAARPGLLGTTSIKWNFTKFLVDRAGRPVRRFGPRRTPAAIEGAVARALVVPRSA